MSGHEMQCKHERETYRKEEGQEPFTVLLRRNG
jgi:hypothetical protein